MEKMAPMNLRALAKDYANGVIGPQAYRKARDDLIEDILSGRIQVTPHDFQPPPTMQRMDVEPDITAFSGRGSQPAAPKPTAAKVETREATQHPPATHRGILAGIAVIIACLVILVALYPFTRQKTPNSAASNQAADTALPSDVQQAVTPGPGEILIKQFLQQNDWTDENLQQFIDQWQGLSAAEQDAALSSSARTQLANAIHRKLVEEHAMLGLGEVQKSIERQTVLINFAHQTGIS
ncbi:MAG: hypothetical protein ACRESK_09435, partial [Gammaproteobacteria bacterium]